MSELFERTLNRPAYESIAFPLLSITTKGGHDSAKHTAYLVPGADIETTGRKAEVYELKIGLINDLQSDGDWDDDVFPGIFQRLIDTFKSKAKGTLSHPTRGNVRVHVDDWNEQLSPECLNGCYLDVTMTEDNGQSIVAVRGQNPSDTQSVNPSSAIEEKAASVDSLVEQAVPDATIRPAKLQPTVTEKLTFLEDQPRGYTEAKGAMNAIYKAIDVVSDASVLEAIEGHDARVAARELRVQVELYEQAYLGTAELSTVIVQTAMSLARLAAFLYKDITQTATLRGANSIIDEVMIPAGTVLVVPPAQ